MKRPHFLPAEPVPNPPQMRSVIIPCDAKREATLRWRMSVQEVWLVGGDVRGIECLGVCPVDEHGNHRGKDGLYDGQHYEDPRKQGSDMTAFVPAKFSYRWVFEPGQLVRVVIIPESIPWPKGVLCTLTGFVSEGT